MERCVQALNTALHKIFEQNKNVCLLGEDILDPYGGAFKVTSGLSTKWPDRVLTMPISEAAMTGIAAGMALRGFRPIVEIMFGDFITLAFDQIVNHIAKFPSMYNGKVTCPLVIRTPMGGRRGYGPTHSQSIEKLLLGVPGIIVVAPSSIHPIGELLTRAVIDDDRPVIFIENKVMYGHNNTPPVNDRIDEFHAIVGDGLYPVIRLSLNRFTKSDVTLLTYGGMASLAMETALQIAIEKEIFVELVIPSMINPFESTVPLDSLRESRRLVIAEEGTLSFGWGAEASASLLEEADFNFVVERVAARNDIVPAARRLEDETLPQKADLTEAIHRVLNKGRRQ